MKKIIMMIFLFCLSFTDVTYAEEVIFTQNTQTTSEDIPLQFEIEKTSWSGRYLKVWGTVANTDSRSYDFVKVTLTVREENGDFITRESTFTSPKNIGPNQVGYIESMMIRCDGKMPGKIEYSVTGN